ncbi:hypothetical protein [Rhizobium beringeri]|uniref:hypothetical protein n=1 Tax=Rhizobium beringeri TaxID=3019934 RepID=UPI003B5CF07B
MAGKQALKPRPNAKDSANCTLVSIVSGEIVCSDLTVDDVAIRQRYQDFWTKIGGPVEKFIADGAYDGTPSEISWRHALVRS